MKPRSHSPTKLDLAEFAREGASLSGEWPVAELPRLAESAAEDAPASGWPAVTWALRGESRQPKGGAAQVWLHLQAQARVALTCQRCLQAVQEGVEVDRWFHFVPDEKLAAELDADSEDDVLALPRHLDARELIEDELLLALPLVPRHAVCPQPLPLASAADEPEVEERPNPFAALEALKRGGPKA